MPLAWIREGLTLLKYRRVPSGVGLGGAKAPLVLEDGLPLVLENGLPLVLEDGLPLVLEDGLPLVLENGLGVAWSREGLNPL